MPAQRVFRQAAATVVSVQLTSTQLLAANEARHFVRITNLGSNLVSIALGAAAVANTGITLAQNQSFQLDEGTSIFRGAINAITVTGAVNVAVLEGT